MEKQRFKVRIDYPDGKWAVDGNIYRLETERGLHNEPILITFDDVAPTHHPIQSGMKITITDWTVKDAEEWKGK